MNLVQSFKSFTIRRHARKIHAGSHSTSLTRPSQPSESLSAPPPDAWTVSRTLRYFDEDSMPPSNSIQVLIDRCLHSPLTPERLLHLHHLLSCPTVDPNIAWDAVLDYMASESFPTISPVLESPSDLTYGNWQWIRYLEETGESNRVFAAVAPVGLAFAASPTAKLLLALPYDIAYKLQSYLTVESLGRIRQTCRQLSSFPVDFYGERRLLYAISHESHCRDRIKHMLAAPRSCAQWTTLRIMVEAVRSLNVPLALEIIQSDTLYGDNDQFWLSWAMFLAIQHCVKVNGPEQSGVGQIIHALLLHPKLPVAAWFLMIPALAQLCNCLESAGVPQWSSDNSIAHTLLSLILNPTAPTPSLTHPIHSTQTRLIIGFTVLSGYCSPEKITALYRALARATTTSFQQSTVDHWLFLFSVQSGNVQLVRHVLTLVRPRALAVSVAGRYVQRQSGAGWSQIGQELTQIQVDVGA